VLACLSVSIYLLARFHLLRQVDQQATLALDALAFAAEQTPSGLEWDMTDRRLSFSQSAGGAPTAWAIFDVDGNRVDGPWQRGLPAPKRGGAGHEEPMSEEVRWNNETWKVVWRTIESRPPRQENQSDAAAAEAESSKKRYAALVMAVADSLDAATAPLEYLAVALTITSLLVWFAVAAGGRWLGTKALAPMTRMAETARTISAADLSQRLPSPGTADELEELGRSFNDLLTRLQISFEQQQRFAAEASHQLRTPLTSIIGEIDVALRREREPQEYRRILELSRGQATRLSQIVDMLLFLTRETAEASPPELEKLDLAAWTTEHLKQWLRHPRYADFRNEIDSSQSYPVKVNSGLLAQAVDNLLDNACKYSDVGKPITLQITPSNAGVRLNINDRGYGIAEEDLAQIYNPFFRAVDARRRGIRGVGLGFTIVRRIITAFRGSLEVESRLVQGTSFSLVFPAVPIEQVIATPVEHAETANAL
jgi:signal transduction histidine kinase